MFSQKFLQRILDSGPKAGVSVLRILFSILGVLLRREEPKMTTDHKLKLMIVLRTDQLLCAAISICATAITGMSVCLSVCLSACCTRALCQDALTQPNGFHEKLLRNSFIRSFIYTFFQKRIIQTVNWQYIEYTKRYKHLIIAYTYDLKAKGVKIAKTRKRAIAKALHLEGRTTSRQTFWGFRVCLV